MRTFLLTLLISLSTLLSAQEDLTVMVINYKTDRPVEGIEVLLRNEARGIEKKQTTDVQGRAVFRSLPVVNGYRVLVRESEDYLDAQSGLIDVRSNESPTVPLALFEQTTVDLSEVVVTAAEGTINRSDAEVSFELEQREIEAIPVEGRDITQVLYRLPNVSRATGFYPEAPNVSINGANSLFTSYLIDGLDNNERFLGGQKFAIPSGFTKNVTVLTNNYSAEYGLTANGVINITTRSGSNDFTGEAFFLTRPGSVLDVDSGFPQRDLSGNLVKEGFARYQGGVALGGPIVKDQTFFYVDLEHTTDLKDNFLGSPLLDGQATIPGQNNFTYLSGKIDHNWNSNFRTSVRANVGLVNIERQGGGLDGGSAFPSAGSIQDRNSVLIAAKNTYVGRNFSTQTNIQYARFRWNYGRPINGDSPQATVLDPSENVIAVLGHPGFVFDELENTWQFQQKFRYYANRHTFKAGVGLISGDHQLFGGGNVNGNYTVKLTDEQINQVEALGKGPDLNVTDIPEDAEVINYAVELRPTSFGARQNIYSAFIEDQWSVTNRLDLTLGLRYDYDDLSSGGGSEGDYNNFAPRLNFNYKLGRRSVIRGGYGIFYDKIPYTIYSDALQQNSTGAHYRAQLQELIDLGVLPADTDIDQITFDGNLTGFTSDTKYLEGPSFEDLQDQREMVFSNERRILNPNGYDNPYTHQFALGYQLQISNKSLFYVDLVHNQSYQLFRLRNLNAAEPYDITREEVENNDPASLVRPPVEADATRPIAIIDGGAAIIDGERLTGVARNVVVSETGGRSRYYAASFNLQQGRGENNYAYRINYTLSYLENNTEDINFRAMDGNDFESEWGPSINDRRHIINGIFSYYPAKGLGVTVAALLQSGQPINRIPDAREFGTTDLNGDGASFGDAYVGNSDRYPGESRNNDRLPWSNQFDLGIQYEFPLGSNSALELRADIFNVFDARNLSGYSNNATQSNQIQPGPKDSGVLIRRNADAPRQFQLGVRYLW